MEDRALNVISQTDAQTKISDVDVVGNTDMLLTLCKASSSKQGWMKGTKALEIPGVGCVVQVTTQQRNPDGSYTLAEALCFVPNVKVVGDVDGGRKLVAA